MGERTDRKVTSRGQVLKGKSGTLPGRETHSNNVVGQGLGCETGQTQSVADAFVVPQAGARGSALSLQGGLVVTFGLSVIW